MSFLVPILVVSIIPLFSQTKLFRSFGNTGRQGDDKISVLGNQKWVNSGSGEGKGFVIEFLLIYLFHFVPSLFSSFSLFGTVTPTRRLQHKRSEYEDTRPDREKGVAGEIVFFCIFSVRTTKTNNPHHSHLQKALPLTTPKTTKRKSSAAPLTPARASVSSQ